MVVKITPVLPIVEHWLKIDPLCRDDDSRLCAQIWNQENNGFHKTANQLLKGLGLGEFTNPESIRRVRQKLQEQDPSLRGTKYIARHANTVNIQNQLGYP